MSQRIAESPAKTSLHPIIKDALASLDVQLEDELKRYRRKKAGKSVFPTRGFSNNTQTPPPVELISLPVMGEAKEPQLPPKMENSTHILPQSNINITQLPIVTLPPANTQAPPDIQPHPEKTLSFPEPTFAEPYDYLQSSEALIKSLDEKPPTYRKKSPAKENIFNPLGVGSILLFLLSCVTLGWVIINYRANNISFASLRNLFLSATTPVAQNPNSTSEINKTKKLPPLPNTPNLAAQEFVDLNLKNISNLAITKPSPTPAASSTPTAASTASPSPAATPAAQPSPNATKSTTSAVSGNLTTALLPNPSAGAGNVLSIQSAPVSPSPQATKSTSVANKNNNTFYYVVSQYKGDQSLQKARSIVADAYLRDFPQGTQIQLGAYKDATTAEVIVQQLRKQGLDAVIYRP